MKKETYVRILNFHVYIIFPACAIFCMYSIGAALLLGKWMWLLVGIILVALSSVITFALGCKAD